MIKFKQNSETFFVEEIPEVEIEGKGEHLFVTFKRKNLSTFYIASLLKKILKIDENEIGIAGNKDKLSTAIQTFSLPARLEPKIIKAFKSIGAEILSTKLHTEKLRMGRIAGNKFKVIVEGDSKDDLEKIKCGLKEVEEQGFPNFFGPQRVSDPSSFEEGKKLFLNKSIKKGRRKGRFMVSVFQSVIFNDYLKKRIERGFYPYPINGDVVRIKDKVVVLKDNLLEKNGEIIITGPIIGSKMTLPVEESFSVEKEVIESFGISFDEIFLSRAKGSRRDCISRPQETDVKSISEGKYEISFTLKSGSYATTLLKSIGITISIPEDTTIS